MQLTHVQLEELLAELHGVPPVRAPALRARIKHLRRLGFPAGLNKGRGNAATYTIGNVLRLLVVFELLQLGITPERAIRLLRGRASVLVDAAGACGRLFLTDEPRGLSDNLILYFDPHALGTLTLLPEAANDPDLTVLGSADTVGWCTADDLAENTVRWSRRFAIVNLTAMLFQAAYRLEELGAVAKAEFGQALTEWASEYGWEPQD
jgi:hypothetical protein